MSNLIWQAMREYIIAESKLTMLRHLREEHCPNWGKYSFNTLDEKIAKAEEQCTRMETEVRRLLDAIPQTPTLSPEQLHTLNMFTPYGVASKEAPPHG